MCSGFKRRTPNSLHQIVFHLSSCFIPGKTAKIAQKMRLEMLESELH